MDTSELLANHLREVMPQRFIELLDQIRSADVLTGPEIARLWEGGTGALESVLNGLCAAEIMVRSEDAFEVTEGGREEISDFFDSIAWARQGGNWDQPLSVAYTSALNLLDETVSRFGTVIPSEHARRLLQLLDVAEAQEKRSPGMIFEAVALGGQNAAKSRPNRVAMVWWLRGRVQSMLGELEAAIPPFCEAYAMFGENGRADLGLAVLHDLERVWSTIASTRSRSIQKMIHQRLEAWGSDRLQRAWRAIWFESDIFTISDQNRWGSADAGDWEIGPDVSSDVHRLGIPRAMGGTPRNVPEAGSMRQPLAAFERESAQTDTVSQGRAWASFREGYRDIPSTTDAWSNVIRSASPFDAEGFDES